jgi:transposase
MVYIGIDVAKDSLVGVRIDKSYRVKEKFITSNTEEDIEKLLNQVTKKWKKITIGSEATGNYHRTLALACLDRNLPYRLLNPIITKQFTRATVRKRKTDLSDAYIIARLVMQKEGTLLTHAMFTHSKPAIRTAVKLAQMTQMLVLMQQQLEMIGMEKYLVAQLGQSQQNLQESQHMFRDFARSTVDQKLKELLMSIPGVGETIATTLITEFGDITRFKTGDCLVAFCGLDPKVKQSGGALHHNTHLTKRGSPYLRRSIYLAASIAQRSDKELKTYFEKKRGEGKFYKEATVANARKIVYRIYAVWKRQTPYIIREV